MRLIPAGEFAMGSDANSDERPIHTLSLADYYIDKYEVTNAFYKVCVDAGTCQSPGSTSSSTRRSYYGNSEFNDFPVIHVNWEMANTYCTWRGANLPSEAEWEKAARGPSTGSVPSPTYPWGDNAPTSDLLNYNKNVGDTSKVGSYESGKSPYGVYDMAGNVWEWVNDWYDRYPGNTDNNSSFGKRYRVLRGGSWSFNLRYARSALRFGNDPANALDSIGFRCSRSVASP